MFKNFILKKIPKLFERTVKIRLYKEKKFTCPYCGGTKFRFVRKVKFPYKEKGICFIDYFEDLFVLDTSVILFGKYENKDITHEIVPSGTVRSGEKFIIVKCERCGGLFRVNNKFFRVSLPNALLQTVKFVFYISDEAFK